MTELIPDPRMQKFLASITKDKDTLNTYSLAPTVPFVIVPKEISAENLGDLPIREPGKAANMVDTFDKNRSHLIELMKQAGYSEELSPENPHQITPEQILVNAGFTEVTEGVIRDRRDKPIPKRETAFRAPEPYRTVLEKLASGITKT
jgi:hypothetical protein